jgi:hydrogenase/urease accessory protein HupE
MTSRRHASLRVLPFVAATAALVSWPVPAEAHLVTTGLGPVYDGISHVLLSPDDLLPVLVLGLLAGLNGPVAGRRALFTRGSWAGSPEPPSVSLSYRLV